MFEDIARFGYGSPTSVGGVMTPTLMGAGASDPTAAYLANFNPTKSGFADTLGLPAVAKTGGVGGFGLGLNIPTAQLALGGLQTIGNLWQAWEANKLAKETFKFQKDFANTNLANQIQSYNTALEDRARARTFTEGGTAVDAQAYIDEHSLRRRA